MNVLFHGKKSFLKSLGIAMLCLAIAAPACSQSQEQGGPDNHKFLYGVHLGLSDNQFELYSTNGGLVAGQNDPSTNDDRSYHARGFRFAVIGEARLGRYFSLRVMPGMSLFRALKLESVRGELPVDVKFHPFRIVNKNPKLASSFLVPYIASGLSYGYDIASLRDDNHNVIKPLNAHDLRYTCSLGLDLYTRILKFGIEMKAGFGLLPPNTNAINPNSFSYFHCGPTISLGLNIEA